jgi:hypothetical protein
MASVADDARARTRELVQAMLPAQRMVLALTLGDEAIDLYARTNGVSPTEARRCLSAQRRRGRSPSAVAAEDSPRP